MELATVFKLSLYGLTAFVGVVLGAAEGGWIPFVSLPVMILGYWWCEIGFGTDHRDARGLAEIPARVLSGLAFSAAALEFFSNNPEGKLLSGTHLVVYLTWVVLLQPKTINRYWLLLTLGVLQVAVSSVLSNASWLGLCMIGDLFAFLWTLSLFSLFRAQQDFVERDRLALGSASTLRQDHTASQSFDSVRQEGHAQLLSFRLVGGTALMSVLGLFVASLFFALIPRIWVGSALGIPDEVLPAALRRSITGLASEVRLGDMGPILESNDPVLTLRLFDNQTNRPLDAETYAEWLGHPEPLFRGVALTSYEKGWWRPDRMQGSLTKRLHATPDDPNIKPVVPTVRQEIHLERLGNDVLFCMGRAIAMRDPEGYRCGLNQPLMDIAIRRDWFKDVMGAVDYTAFSELPPPDARVDVGMVPTSQTRVIHRITNYLKRCTQVPEDLTRLTDLSREIVDAQRQRLERAPTDLETARAIESHLRDSGLYTYSLVAPTVDSKLDPVEDFLFYRRAGHCQYFASALGLMLRSVGIPARLVTGFKGGERLSDGALNVEKRFAHVWVEAWIGDEKWVTFDATPETPRLAGVSEVGSKRNAWSTLSSRLAGAWEYSVLNISYENQEQLIYGPVRGFFSAVWEHVRNFFYSPQTSLRDLALFLVNPSNWMTLPGAFALALLVGLPWLHRRGLLKLRGWSRQPPGAMTGTRRVAFYERFARLMKSHGLERQPAETQGEFTHHVAHDLTGRLQAVGLTEEVARIGDVFYRVRFGDEIIPAEEASHLEELLQRVETALGPGTHRQTRTPR